ncbi:calpain-5 isoform X1 [Lingula anatina]|uniref:Calpain-5 isoform X1 n=1 Tax=Lingula anatina TaxID=7574 RepID=A0A1S3GYT4_LINAN|nr:calpain-5 isoform X1 [Lingula anatina]|eukprot:XP_013379035.1 calpain-5 isoform X1 [Lingula anatina]
MFRSPDPFKGQKYESIKKDCIKRGQPFVDPEFQPNNKSLFYSKVDSDIEWKRPGELCKVPRLVVEGVTTDDLNQGELGNVWFVTACTSLAHLPKLWQKVVPNHKEQDWGPESEYAGIFHFHFWRYGCWVDVVVDDLLPTKNGKLVFCHSKNKNEFWSALLEKAYAKLYGDYETLKTGYPADALVDFTGGVAEKLDLMQYGVRQNEDDKMEFFEELLDASENSSLIIATISCPETDVGQSGRQGLMKGYGYGVTAVKKISVNKGLQAATGSGTLLMLRLNNPWGTQEWTGAWSDQSEEWKNLSEAEKKKLGLTFQNEGEFWMRLDDFIQYFENVDMCHFVNTSFFSLKKTWYESLMPGEWTQGARGSPQNRSGGAFHNKDSFLNNPQFVFDIKEDTDTAMISLEQDDKRADKKIGGEHLQIGFHIMKVEENRKYRVHIPGEKCAETDFKQSRNIYGKYVLRRGRYVIIPSTYNPGSVGKFLLRLYTGANSSSNIRELTKEGPERSCCICIKQPQIVLTITIIKARDLEKRDKDKSPGEPNPYVEIKCEGETVKAPIKKNTAVPEWGTMATFYLKKPEQPIIVDVFNHKTLLDEFIGQATIPDLGTMEGEEKEYDLFGKSKKEKKEGTKYPGSLRVRLQSSYDLTDL